jgi:hypothetical protein
MESVASESLLSQYLSPLSSIADIKVQSRLCSVSLEFLLDAANYDYQGQLSDIAQQSGYVRVSHMSHFNLF